MANSDKTKVRRSPGRGIYDRDKIYELLDKQFLCHVAFTFNGEPVTIPTMFGRDGDSLLIHGATVSRLITSLEAGIPVCVSIAQVNDLVLARSAFHHAMNYESIVVFGKATLVPENEKLNALKAMSDHLIPGRWEEVRKPNEKELKATKVLRISMDDASAKARYGDPIDDDADYELPIWAGTVPTGKGFGTPTSDSRLPEELKSQIPESVNQLLTKHQ